MRFPHASAALALAAAALCAALPAHAQKLPRPSPDATLTQTIGLTDFKVTYSRPGVKNRVIWGELVPYDKPWRTGANEATTFTTSDSIQFGGKGLAAGTYALLTIPGKDEWTLALNSESIQWGSTEYKPEKDVLRVTIKPTAAEHEEWMRFSFENLTPASGDLVLRWEKLSVTVPIVVDVNTKALANCRAAIAAAKPGEWRPAFNSARWAFTNEQALDEAKGWLDKSLAVEKNYSNLGLLAKWQMKDGKKSDAIKTANQAVAAGKASKDKVDTSEIEKLLVEWTGAPAAATKKS